MIPNQDLQVKQFFNSHNRFKTVQCKTIKNEWVFRSGGHIAEHPDRFSLIQVNATNLTQALAFDVDHEDPLIFSDYGLPTPSIITINKENGKSHILYYLKAPVSVGKAKDYMLDLYDGITEVLRADTNYTARLTKNYMNEQAFRVYGSLNSYELADFRDFTAKHRKVNSDEKKSKISYFSRNCELFDTVRFYAYKIKNNFSGYDEFFADVLKKAEMQNQTLFREPLPQKEVKNTAKSIAAWTWDNEPEIKKLWNWDGYDKKPKEEVSKTKRLAKQKDHEQRLKIRLKKRLQEIKRAKFFDIPKKITTEHIESNSFLYGRSTDYYQDNYSGGEWG